MSYPIKSIIVLGAGSAGLMTAMLCKKFLKNIDLDVKIVQSGQVPILGVGEGTTEHIQEFIKHCDIDINEFITETKATLKSGVLFKDWNYEGHEYVHSLSEIHATPMGTKSRGFAYATPHFHDGIPLGGYATFVDPSIDETDIHQRTMNGLMPFQFHFNNFALNDYLRKKCNEMGIEIVDDYITDVDMDVNFNIRAIIGDNRHEADFFFDCSGFKRLLISKHEPKFEDYSKQLIVDRALFFPYKTEDNPLPYTLAKAMKYGWFWQAPTQDRTGNGYVFSSKHCTAEMALEEVREMGYDLPDDVANNVKEFKSGHIKKSWTKNVAAIGVASSFFEPLEAAALSTGVLQVVTVLDYLHAYDNKSNHVQNVYNDIFAKLYKNSFEFIRLHYISEREDTSFWKEYKSMRLPQSLSDKINLYKKRPATWVEYDLPPAFNLYGPLNFLQVMSGLNLIDSEAYVNYVNHKGLASQLHTEMVKISHFTKMNKNSIDTHSKVLEDIRKEYKS
jgi:tryptophan halogenase